MTARRFVSREPAATDLASDPLPGIGVQALRLSRALGTLVRVPGARGGAPQAAGNGAR